MREHLIKIREVFDRLNFDWVEPYYTTEGAINRKEVGNHTGLYYIYPEVNFYFGKATKENTVIERHKSHRAKLDVNLKTLYSNPVEKAEPRWQFPEGWKEGICKYIIEGVDEIPKHFIKIGKRRVIPGVLNFEVNHIVNVDDLTVIVWNLDHLSHPQISQIEKKIISELYPYCNNETYRRRKKERSQ